MKYVRHIGLVTVMLLVFNCVSSAQEKLKPNFKVSLCIFGDKDIKQDTESYLSRELRSLGDVTVTTPDVDLVEDCLLWCNIKELRMVSGKLTGLVFSVVYCERQNVEGLYTVQGDIYGLLEEIKTIRESELPDRLIARTAILWAEMSQILPTIGKYSMQYSSLYAGRPDSLRTLCEMAITDFDSNFLKEKRKAIAK